MFNFSSSGDKPNRVAVMIQHEKAEFLLCTLDNKHSFQHSLDLNFTEGEEVTFFLNGTGKIYLFIDLLIFFISITM